MADSHRNDNPASEPEEGSHSTGDPRPATSDPDSGQPPEMDTPDSAHADAHGDVAADDPPTEIGPSEDISPMESAHRTSRSSWFGLVVLMLVLGLVVTAIVALNRDDASDDVVGDTGTGATETQAAREAPQDGNSSAANGGSAPDQTLAPQGLPYIPPQSDCQQDVSISVARMWNEEILEGIRRSFPNPPVHARNLYHLSAAMWDAWAAYSPEAHGLFVDEDHTAADIEAARNEAISYAAFRIIADRYATSWGAQDTMLEIARMMSDLCYDAGLDIVIGDEPYAVGNRIADTILSESRLDGSNELDGYADPDYEPLNPPLVLGASGTDLVDPDRWQPLQFDVPAQTQHGQALSSQLQTAIGTHWGFVTPFAIPADPDFGNPMHAPGQALFADAATRAEYVANAVEVIRFSSKLGVTDDSELIDVSPGALGNNTVGNNDGTGHSVNPATGEPYEPDLIAEGDFGRVVAEYWADGPNSETPPGHWNTIANMVADSPELELRIGGQGPEVNRLEWDVKMYIAVNGAVHDAAIGAWGSKGFFDSVRPISMIRYLCQRGQSSDPSAASYDPEGITLEDDLIEVITEESSAPGERHEALADHIGEIAVRSWAGYPDDPLNQSGGVTWILGVDWVPYQQRSFVTPSFPGYVSGHSTFSRAAAEVLAGLTGSEYFPGGMGSVAFAPGALTFEAGPVNAVTLEWGTYFDASDQAGISRLYGGIHIRPDDRDGRIMGSEIGQTAWAKAQTLWSSKSPS
ncbi:MAG: vanadium-dependent haloperoxidase [Actinobacteria bacterium]|nr:vanadium-dependent haloperoxidase [Actinomycetota bacterium]